MLQSEPMHFAPSALTNHLVPLVDDIKYFLSHLGRLCSQRPSQSNKLLKRDLFRADLGRKLLARERTLERRFRPISFKQLPHHFPSLRKAALDDPAEGARQFKRQKR